VADRVALPVRVRVATRTRAPPGAGVLLFRKGAGDRDGHEQGARPSQAAMSSSSSAAMKGGRAPGVPRLVGPTQPTPGRTERGLLRIVGTHERKLERSCKSGWPVERDPSGLHRLDVDECATALAKDCVGEPVLIRGGAPPRVEEF
jgi:hypothetical protein